MSEVAFLSPGLVLCVAKGPAFRQHDAGTGVRGLNLEEPLVSRQWERTRLASEAPSRLCGSQQVLGFIRASLSFFIYKSRAPPVLKGSSSAAADAPGKGGQPGLQAQGLGAPPLCLAFCRPVFTSVLLGCRTSHSAFQLMFVNV